MRRFELVLGRRQDVQKYKPENQHKQLVPWDTCIVILKKNKLFPCFEEKKYGPGWATVDKTIYSEVKVDSGNALRNQYFGV